jgi:hypothetical protein
VFPLLSNYLRHEHNWRRLSFSGRSRRERNICRWSCSPRNVHLPVECVIIELRSEVVSMSLFLISFPSEFPTHVSAQKFDDAYSPCEDSYYSISWLGFLQRKFVLIMCQCSHSSCVIYLVGTPMTLCTEKITLYESKRILTVLNTNKSCSFSFKYK